MKYLDGELLINLAKVNDTEKLDALEKIYNWEINYKMEYAKYFIGTGLSVLASLLFAYLKGETDKHPILTVISLICTILTIIIGFIRFWELKQFQRDYLQTVDLLSNLSSIIKQFPTLFR